MIVPLTDSTNPYTAMMLELIANDRRYPSTKYPRQDFVPSRAATRVARGRRLALIAAALIGVAAIAATVTGLI